MKREFWFFAGFTLLCLIVLSAAVFYGLSRMAQKSYTGHFLPLSEEEQEISSNLHNHIYRLADQIGERNIWQPEKLSETAAYIEQSWQEQGYTVRRQEYDARGVPAFNLEIGIPGTSKAEEIILIGAHYDSVVDCPGANDNGSGVASLLEIARLLDNQKHSRTIRLVTFTNEEPPFFLRPDMGSKVYAKTARKRNDNIVAMLSLETMGYYSEEPHSQEYPFPFSFFYPHTANFIGFVGNLRSGKLVKQSLAAFRRHTQFPSEGTAVPGWITGIGWSDHWSFWRQGYRAIMVTDTAFFRYHYYHTTQDTPEKIDYDRLARVTLGLSHVVNDLANAK